MSGSKEDIPDDVLRWCDGVTDEDLPECVSPMGHSLTPINDAEGGPRTRMVCVRCNASRPVQDGDLDGYSDTFKYPEWCTMETGNGKSGVE